MDFLIIGFLIGLAIFGDSAAVLCGPAEYNRPKDGECCPMCGKGYVVHKDCTDFSSTTCIPCVGDTYMSEPNGLNKCFKCKACDMKKGLNILWKCTTFSDAVCAVLPGYYCQSYTEDNECTLSEKHSVCSPGQGLKRPGTEHTDTVCEDCREGYFSIYGINCTKHTNCAVQGEELEEKGSYTKDNKCRKRQRRRDRQITVIVFIGFAFSVFLLFLQQLLKVATTGIKAGSTAVVSSSRTLPIQKTGEGPDQYQYLSQPVEDDERSMEGLSLQRRMPSSVS